MPTGLPGLTPALSGPHGFIVRLRSNALLGHELEKKMIAILPDGTKQEFKPQASMTGKRFLGVVLSEQDVGQENKEWLAASVFPRISGEAEKLHQFLGLDV